jgi:hypothetical protein
VRRQVPLWVSAAEAETLLDVKAATVRSWARRRRLLPRGLDDLGRPLYASGEILVLAGRAGAAGGNDVHPDQGKQVPRAA